MHGNYPADVTNRLGLGKPRWQRSASTTLEGSPVHLTEELLGLAEAKLKKAEVALAANPTNRWLKMSVDFLREEVATISRLRAKYDKRESSPPASTT